MNRISPLKVEVEECGRTFFLSENGIYFVIVAVGVGIGAFVAPYGEPLFSFPLGSSSPWGDSLCKYAKAACFVGLALKGLLI